MHERIEEWLRGNEGCSHAAFAEAAVGLGLMTAEGSLSCGP